MTRPLLYLLSTIAPSVRFPVMWARLNRVARLRRPSLSTLRSLVAKLVEGLSGSLDRLAVRDAAVNDEMAARLGTLGAAADAKLEAADAVLRRYWSRTGEAPAVVATAAATLATFVVALLAQLAAPTPAAGGVAGPRTSRAVAAAAVTTQGEVAAVAEAPVAAEAPAVTSAPSGAAGESAEVAAPAPPPATWTPGLPGALPIGKGMWLYVPERVEGGDPHAIVAKAKAIGITHVYVRTGSSKMGFYAQDFLDRLLPVAHEGGLRVYGWDFPYFYSWSDDVYRALAAITYTTPDGHRIDGFSPDIETEAEGTQVSAHHAHEYGAALRRLAGPDYPLIATVPRPSSGIVKGGFPYAELAPHFDAFAPMVYWMQRDSASEAVAAMEYLAQFGRPVMPVGQAYDGGLDGGHPGVPSAESIIRFMQAADAKGAPAVSFWSWQHADDQAWHAIHVAAEFQLAAGTPEQLPRGMVVAYQTALAQYGFDVHPTGVWDGPTTEAVRAYQTVIGLPSSGIIDEPTLAALLRPFPPPTSFSRQ